MNKFCLITNRFKDREMIVTGELEDYIKKKGGSVRCLETGEIRGGEDDFNPDEIPEDTECVVVLGGDGTMIRVATRIEHMNIPMIGMNLGHLGYLCELEKDSVFEAIDRLMQDSFSKEERMMLSGKLCETRQERSALNDIVIHQTGTLSILILNVYVNGEFLSTFYADGMIVATPTGATGYNLSAGGPIVDPKAQMILLTPINAHNLSARSIVLSGDAVVEIELVRRDLGKEERAAVSFDGDRAMDIVPGQRLVVRSKDSFIRILRLKKESFLEIMRKKMEGN